MPRNEILSKGETIQHWLIAIMMFTFVWTGTFLHDFFGLDVLPAITQTVTAVHLHDATQLTSSQHNESVNRLDEQSASQLPCSCPSHVHSPYCLSKAEQSEVSSAVKLIMKVLVTSLVLKDWSLEHFAPSRDPPRIDSRRAGPAIYLANCSLLI